LDSRATFIREKKYTTGEGLCQRNVDKSGLWARILWGICQAGNESFFVSAERPM
jgi:hypothetical protein